MPNNICPCPHCWSGSNGPEAVKIAKDMRTYWGLPKKPPSKRWGWPQNSNLFCECANCRRMGKENDIHVGNVNEKMKRRPFEHYGMWIPRYWCVGSLWGTNWSNHHDHIYHPPHILNRT